MTKLMNTGRSAKARRTASVGKQKTGRPSLEDAAKTDERLLDAATALFLANGFAKTTMEKIARKAQASTKTVYARYASKGDALAAVIRRLMERTIAGDAFDTAAPSNMTDARACLRDLCLRFALLASAPQTAGINRLVIAEAAQFPDLAGVLSEGPERARTIIRSALEHFQKQGDLPQMPEPDAAATLLFDMATSTPRMRALLGPRMTQAAISSHVETAVALFLAGCGHAMKRRNHAARPKSV